MSEDCGNLPQTQLVGATYVPDGTQVAGGCRHEADQFL